MYSVKLEQHVSEVKKGKTEAFEYVYDCTYKAVYFAAYGVLFDKQAAEDVTQETYITALNKLALYKEGGNFTGWLVTIAKRLAINEYNKKKSSAEFSVDYSENESLYGECRVEDAHNTTFDIAKQILPEDEFNIINLCVMAGYKRREVAEILKIPIGTVTWKYNEGLKKLKKYLKETDNE